MLVLRKQNDLYDPWRSMLGFDRVLDSMFDIPSENYQEYAVKVDVTEDEDAYKITAVAPGVKKEDTQIKIEDGALYLEIDHPEVDLKEGEEYLRKEINHGRYFARYNLSPNIKIDKIKASFDNGILTVVVPKEEKAKPINIKIS